MSRIELTIEQIKQLPLTHQTVIPEDYLDAMEHVNVMWYVHLFGHAMGEVFRRVHMDWERLAEHQCGTFALEGHVRYLSEVRAGQTVEIYSRVLGRSEKRIHVIHFMVNQEKKDLSATQEIVGAHVDLRSRRMAPMPPESTKAIDALLEEHRALSWEAPTCGVMRS